MMSVAADLASLVPSDVSCGSSRCGSRRSAALRPAAPRRL